VSNGRKESGEEVSESINKRLYSSIEESSVIMIEPQDCGKILYLFL